MRLNTRSNSKSYKIIIGVLGMIVFFLMGIITVFSFPILKEMPLYYYVISILLLWLWISERVKRNVSEELEILKTEYNHLFEENDFKQQEIWDLKEKLNPTNEQNKDD